MLVTFVHAQMAEAATIKTQTQDKKGVTKRHDILFHPMGKTIVVKHNQHAKKLKEKVVGDVSFVE